MFPRRSALMLASVLVPTAGASAADLSRADDFDALCALSETVETAFPVFVRAEVSDVPEPTRAPTPVVPEVLTDAEVGRATESDPVLAALRAREYARARLDAVVQTYEVTVDSRSFPLWTWDPELGSVVVNTGADLEVSGSTRLVSPLDSEPLIFPMSEQDAELLLAANAMGATSVRLTVALGARDQPWQPICRQDDMATSVDVRIVAAELTDSWTPGPSARAQTVAWEQEHVREQTQRAGLSGGQHPVVEVMSMEIETDEGCTTDEATLLRAGMESLLADCYAAGLDRNASLHGATVFAFDLQPDGAVRDPSVAIDALDDDWVRDCALAALERMAIPRAADAGPASVRSRVRFALEN